MRTVAEFRQAGLEFVDGDVCQEGEGLEYGRFWYAHTDSDENCFGSCPITKFARRQNTSVTPSFTGMVEVKRKNGDLEIGIASDFHWAILDHYLDIIWWRPVLDQSVEEPELEHIDLSDNDKAELSQILIAMCSS